MSRNLNQILVKIHEKNFKVIVNEAFSNFWYGIKFSYNKVMGNALYYLHLLLLEKIPPNYELGFVTLRSDGHFM